MNAKSSLGRQVSDQIRDRLDRDYRPIIELQSAEEVRTFLRMQDSDDLSLYWNTFRKVLEVEHPDRAYLISQELKRREPTDYVSLSLQRLRQNRLAAVGFLLVMAIGTTVALQEDLCKLTSLCEAKPAPSVYDGSYFGSLRCETTPGDDQLNDLTRPFGRPISLRVSANEGRYLKGPQEPLDFWDGGLFHESFDFQLRSDGSVIADGVYQYIDEQQYPNPAVGVPMITDTAFLEGVVSQAGIWLEGTRGPRNCTLNLSRK